jgi:hypothetical protein
MGVEPPGQAPAAGRYSAPSYEEGRGEGWLTFAGVMLALVGTMNVINGIAAIDDANVYVADAHYTFGDLNTWGWVVLITGSVQVFAALGIFVRNQLARWLGVGFAGLNMLANLLFLPAFPLLSLALFAVDVLIIYGLVAYGDRD